MADSLIDFSTTPLSKSYSTFYAKIVDNLFSPAECAALIDLAASTPGGWQPAGLSASVTGPTQTVHTDFRNSDRILRTDPAAAAALFTRLRPHVEPDLGEIAPGGRWAGITGKPGRKQGAPWKLVGLNPRLSFLRYGPGHYFKPHCDGLVDLHDGAQKSFVTIHLYLNEGDGLSGGETRFWTPDKKEFLDVEPKLGRALIFQQRMLVHSGEEVAGGIKYTMRTDFMFTQRQ